MTAPVQLLTIGLDEAQVPESVVSEFLRLDAHGHVRVLDVLFVRHTDDGDLDTLDRPDADRMRFDGSLLTKLLTTSDAGEPLRDDVPLWSFHDAVPRGQLAALVLVEHLWAEPLASAVVSSGGRLFDEFWLTSEDRKTIDDLLAARG